MKLMKKASEPIITRKRPPDDSNDCNLERFKKRNRMEQPVRNFSSGCGIQETDRKHSKKLSPKLPVENNQLSNFRANESGRIKHETGSRTRDKCRFSDQICSKSAGAPKPKVTTTVVTQKKPWKHLDEVDTYHAKMASHNKDRSVNSQPLEYDELKGNEVADMKRNKPSFGSKHAGKVNVTPRKQPPDYSNDCDLERLKKRKRMVQADCDFSPGCGIQETDRKPLKKLSPKLAVENSSSTTSKGRFFDQTCSKSAGAQKPKVTTTVGTQRKPWKHLDKDKSVNSQPLKYDDLKRTDLAHFKRNTPSFGAKPLKNNNSEDNKPSLGSKQGKTQISEVTNTSLSQKEHNKHEKIKEVMKYFDEVYQQLYHENKLKPKREKIAHWRVPLEAAKLVQHRFKWMEPKKRVGPIWGVHTGDKFKFRSQLKMVGLHCQHRSGIDYININGMNLAISIVDSHCYSNERKSSDMLIYSGHGGLGDSGRKLPPKDQKLERGNLALINSMEEHKPVRVIRKVGDVFVYDGLYAVTRYTQKRGEEGKIVFNFHLKREPGQPPLF
ncbi:hypothetical protein SSX86_020388 [Deinandra increscens subsp. villosa]|uniref:YDG domain-containing protein n=1 Tax=Deinandra increscens subsp. villosa TaxID=3103831 RepID=A0AAP0GTE9_9ASTR